MKDILYAIGETLLLELDGVKEVTYPKENETPNMLFIEMANGKKITLAINENN